MKKLMSFVLVVVLLVSLGSINAFAADKSKTAKDAEEKKITFKHITPIDTEEFSITIEALDPDNINGYTLKACFENRSSETNYTFAVPFVSINGIDVDYVFATDVAPGNKASKEISIPTQILKDEGITEFTDFKIGLRIQDSDNWLAGPIVEKTCHVYPYGKENAKKYRRESNEKDIVVVDSESITYTVTDFGTDKDNTYFVNLYYVNKTDGIMSFSVGDMSVNGHEIKSVYERKLQPKTAAFAHFSWTDPVFQENDSIYGVEEIAMTLKAYVYGDWLAGPIYEEGIVLNP